MLRASTYLTTLIALGLALSAGCNSQSGPPRYKLKGEITFAGQPISNGQIVFTPDNAKGNSGPQGVATIKDGKYDTSAPDGRGVGSGPTIIRVTGQDETNVLICEFEESVDLPKQDSERKIEVPATAGTRKPASPEI
jgi:hypothetical protein